VTKTAIGMKDPEDRPPTGLEQDTAAVLVWLADNAGRELTRQEISTGTGIPNGTRLHRAVRQARAAGALLGNRLETFYKSEDPRRRGQMVTRYNLKGHGDKLSARDALHTSKQAIAKMKDMERSCTYEGENENGFAPTTYKEIASAVGGCIQTVSGMGKIGEEVSELQRRDEARAQRVAELEAELARRTDPGKDLRATA
jgi:hypothetical protein